MKTSELLREAKKGLWWGNSCVPDSYASYIETSYVCIAIDRAGVRTGHSYLARNLRERLRIRLGKHDTVLGWLRYEVGVPEAHITGRNVQAYRHRWLDALIAEYEAKGD